MKYILITLILLISIGIAHAGEMVEEDYKTVHIYGKIDKKISMGNPKENIYNYNKTVCHNATVIEGYISICGSQPYELEYTFIADINDTDYISRILTIKQELISSSFLGGKVINRTLILDGNIISNYETKCSFWSKIKKNKVYYDLIENNIKFGNNIINNESLAFTQLNYLDQQTYLLNPDDKHPVFPITHYYKSVGLDKGESDSQLKGLTGVFYNVFGASVLTEIPLLGDHLAAFGQSIQGLIYLPLLIIQLSFNIIFTFLVLIFDNMWYALLLFEIFCIIPSLEAKGYSDTINKLIERHVIIFKFMYQVIVLQTINLILRLIEIIRNMFRI
jgi:hypothetical protein